MSGRIWIGLVVIVAVAVFFYLFWPGGADENVLLPESGTETTQPAEQPAQPAEQPAQPAEQPAQPAEQPAQPAEQPAQPAEQPAQPAEPPAAE